MAISVNVNVNSQPHSANDILMMSVGINQVAAQLSTFKTFFHLDSLIYTDESTEGGLAMSTAFEPSVIRLL